MKRCRTVTIQRGRVRAAWERRAGDGDLSEVTRAPWRVLDVLVGYRHAPAPHACSPLPPTA